MELFAFDDDYVRRLRSGDRWTEEHFLSYFHELLLIKLRTRIKSMAEIEDIRQEVFVRVFRALRSNNGVRDGRKLGAYVNAICNNVMHESQRVTHRTEPLDPHHDPAGDVDIEQAFSTMETKEHVRRALASLPEKDAQLLRALFLEERDKDEICAAFGVDRDYLRVLLHRAKERFRAEYHGGDVVEISRRGETKTDPASLSD
ncbi:MAG TPA: RNA polymerase sigma factor [Thermoanaerobaculia bacterium]|nr:RNA polymerase sigma factor [Thermoanaerobaculia bacterium]